MKSGNRQPVPVTTRFYSPWKKRFSFNDTTESSGRSIWRRRCSGCQGCWAEGSRCGCWILEIAVSEYDGEGVEEECDGAGGEGVVKLARIRSMRCRRRR